MPAHLGSTAFMLGSREARPFSLMGSVSNRGMHLFAPRPERERTASRCDRSAPYLSGDHELRVRQCREPDYAPRKKARRRGATGDCCRSTRPQRSLKSPSAVKDRFTASASRAHSFTFIRRRDTVSATVSEEGKAFRLLPGAQLLQASTNPIVLLQEQEVGRVGP